MEKSWYPEFMRCTTVVLKAIVFAPFLLLIIIIIIIIIIILLLLLFLFLSFFPWTMNLSTADLRNYWKWQTSRKFWKRRIAPLMVTYHYDKFYVSIIIHFEVININVRNFNFPIGFSYVGRLWWPELIPDIEKFLTGLHFQNGHHNTAKIEHCSISKVWIFTTHFLFAVFWQPFWKWQTSWQFRKCRIALLMVTYHYDKFYDWYVGR
jgi:hypothetical protein